VKKKFVGEDLIWPDEKLVKRAIRKYRIEFEKISVVDEWNKAFLHLRMQYSGLGELQLMQSHIVGPCKIAGRFFLRFSIPNWKRIQYIGRHFFRNENEPV